MEPLIVLVLLPVLIGVASEWLLHDVTKASLVAAILSPLPVYLRLALRDPGGTWNWLATLLISPLTIAIALSTVFICVGRAQARKHSSSRA